MQATWGVTPRQVPLAERPNDGHSISSAERMAKEQFPHGNPANQPPSARGSLLKAAEVSHERPSALYFSGFQLDLSLVHLQGVIVTQQLGLRDGAVLLLLCFLHRALGHVFRGVLHVLGALGE